MWTVMNTKTLETDQVDLPKHTPKRIVAAVSTVSGKFKDLIIEWT